MDSSTTESLRPPGARAVRRFCVFIKRPSQAGSMNRSRPGLAQDRVVLAAGHAGIWRQRGSLCPRRNQIADYAERRHGAVH